MSDQMRQIVLAARPEGRPGPEHFRLETAPIPQPGEGEALLRVLWLSLDPYMRGRMDAGPSYATPVEIGAPMTGGVVGEVVESRSDRLKPGDLAMGMLGWATHGVAPVSQLRKLDPEAAPPSAALGVLGMPGFTGWHGLTAIGRPKAGETLVVGAATGPVGSMVGQLGKARGMRVVGVAGGAEKCAMARDVFGFDACVDHRAQGDARAMRAALAEACPDGVDVYFENVGGKTLEAVIPLMNTGGRIPVCGMVSWYNAGGLGEGATQGPDRLPKVWRAILVKRLTVGGFIISDHFDRFGAFLKEVAPMVRDGSVAYRESVTEGLENAPAAFIGMLEGANTGKTLVKIG